MQNNFKFTFKMNIRQTNKHIDTVYYLKLKIFVYYVYAIIALNFFDNIEIVSLVE